MKRGSSLRFIEWPMPEISGEVLGSMALSSARGDRGGGRRGLDGQRRLQLGGGMLDGFDDVDVAGAAAEVAGDRLADLLLRRVRVARQQGGAGEHHPRRAVAALQAVLLPEPVLDRVQGAVLLQPLDGGDLAAV